MPVTVAVGCVLAMVGCAGGTSASTSGEMTSLRVALGYEPMSMDLCDASSARNGMFMTENIGEPLVDVNFKTTELEPKLATSWKQVDPNTWQFELRQGVTFHNGAPLNAKAVADWVNRILDPKLGCWLYGSVLDDNVKEAVAVDDDTVNITTASPDMILPQRLAFVMIGLADGDQGKKTQKPIGTGPYKFVSYQPGAEVKVERFEKYWGKAPQFRQVTYPIRVESSVRSAMSAAGEVDIATMIANQDAKAKGAVNFTVGETIYFRIDVNLPPFNDIRVRRALSLAIDRATFVKNVYGGLGEPANAIVVPTTVGYPDDVTYPYDPAQAKALLDEARRDGVNVGAPFKVVGWAGMRGSNGSEVPDTIVAMLKEVGFNATTQLLETESMRNRLGSANDPKFGPAVVLNAHGNSLGDALVSLRGKLGCKAPQSPVCDDQLDALLKQAAETAGDHRADLLAQAFRYEHDKLVALVPVAHMADTMIITNDRVSYTPNLASSERLDISEVSAK
ncbi:ABC transporter substrate-binding protein [Micromonospora globispora]|uniref:ABC transporter substrate-binding protein n=2 Tax=Micromonospora globispora TaxID=1450148 RepID=UPI001402A561|nr:ABC transporter substrate-binding protein [Micromonospora globispora]